MFYNILEKNALIERKKAFLNFQNKELNKSKLCELVHTLSKKKMKTFPYFLFLAKKARKNCLTIF